ncbi:hypothetical protein AOCH_005204 [Aspergillus ochraceoroseus]|uniref:Adenosine deaminase domain-containing protein n=1 Tax=Aspergillus ochraceoroseus TaxID=138278 RepID=A0A0F8XMG9_9EURO|nr:hypothetical protein AOCH_005204 [Aspergillus ochraceoroseus]
MDPDNRLWEIEEGVPQLLDPFIQKFLAGRRSLIQEEKSQQHDSNLCKALPEVAIRARKIVSRICSATRLEHGGIPHPSLMSDPDRERLESSDLWKIVRNLPKGSLLYGHLPVMIDIDFLIDQALATPGIYISAPNPLITHHDFENATFFFHYMPAHQAEVEGSKDKPELSLWSDSYEPSASLDLQTAAALFPHGGQIGFRDWLKRRCAVSSENHPCGRRTSPISNLFNHYLPIVSPLFHHEPILRVCLRRIFSQLVADKINYVEFRLAFDFQYTREGAEKPEADYFAWFHIFQEEISLFQSLDEGKNFYGARIIWAAPRNLSNKDIGESMKECIIMKKRFPALICGFDLLGQESTERPLHNLLPILFWFRGRCAEETVNIPFIFSAGQSMGAGDDADGNLFDAVLLSSRRISQGFGFTNSFQAHPIPALLSREVSVALCNDSPGIFGNGENGLSSEFWQALLAFQNMGLTGLAMLVENSIRWSCYEDQTQSEWGSDIQEGILGEGEKAARLHAFYAEFESFCQWVVREYGEKYPVEV